MRTGAILYVVGENPVGEATDFGSAVKRMEPGIERVEVVGKDVGHFDIADAWWALTAKGMHRIVCLIGESNAAGAFKIHDKMLRLCG